MKTFVWILVILMVLGGGAAIYLHNLYNTMLEPVDPAAADNFKIVEIPRGVGSERIASILYNEGLIQNELAFRLYVRQTGTGRGFMAGSYNLNPAMSVEEIVKKLESGDVYAETLWFTIPEGFTVKEIAGRLAELGLADENKILSLSGKAPAELSDAFPMLVDATGPSIEYQLEGYLFPDTYEIYARTAEEDIIRIMLQQMEAVLDDLDYRSRIDQLDISLHELLTIASLIEREARVDHERPLVAGVIYNRLAIGQRLQIDATIQYILEEPKEFLLYVDLEIPSPYNTYLNDGLPPGPIAAPGRESIKAALNPAETDYYYYNYKYDGTGEHYFSRTYEEHLANVAKAEANLP